MRRRGRLYENSLSHFAAAIRLAVTFRVEFPDLSPRTIFRGTKNNFSAEPHSSGVTFHKSRVIEPASRSLSSGWIWRPGIAGEGEGVRDATPNTERRSIRNAIEPKTRLIFSSG